MREVLQNRVATESSYRKGHGIFISGGLGKATGLRPVLAGLEEVYGVGHATVYSSALLGDVPSADKYDQMGAQIRIKLAEGPVHIIAHSFGAAELCAAFDQIEKSESFPLQKSSMKDLKITLISPTGLFESWQQGVGYIARFSKVGIQEGGILGRTVPGKTSILGGVASFGVIPPEDIMYDRLVHVGRESSPGLSQAQEGIPSFSVEPQRNYIPVFDVTQQACVRDADAQLVTAIDSGDKKNIRNAIKKRGRKTRSLMRNVLDGKYADAFNDREVPHDKQKRTRKGVASQLKLAKETFLQGKVLERMRHLKEAGVEIEIMVPEQDIMVTVEEAQRLAVPLRIIPFSTHSSPWGAQPEAIKKIAETQ